MPIFSYVARNLKGDDHKGTIETSDEHQAARILSKKGLVVISVKKKAEENKSFFYKFLNRVTLDDLVIATRQLATMIESGLVLSEALDVLVEQESNKRFKKILAEVARDVKSGLDFASALKKHPDIFPPLYSNLVKAGEQSGNLDNVLSQMANGLERDREFRGKIIGALIYPVLIIMMMIVMVLIMMFFVIPRLTTLYTQSNIELPLPTKILIGTSNFLINYWWILLVGIVVAAIVFKRWISTTSGRMTFDTFLLNVPIAGKVVQGVALTNFTRTFGLLTTAGIPLLDAIAIVSNVVGNMVYKKALEEAYRAVERGLTFSLELDSLNVFPRIIPQMLHVGEETGKIDKVAFKLADYFESETGQLVKNLTVVIEPVILVILGVGVAFIVLSIILPIYKLTTSFS